MDEEVGRRREMGGRSREEGGRIIEMGVGRRRRQKGWRRR